MAREQTNHQVALKMYVAYDEEEKVKQLMAESGFSNMSDFLRHCVEVANAQRIEEKRKTDPDTKEVPFKFHPRNWGGYRPRQGSKNLNPTM